MSLLLLGDDPRFDLYVDSINGSDASTGKAPGLAAFKTFAAARTALGSPSTPKSIGLARGSVFKEECNVDTSGAKINNITIGSYGSGALPLIDGSDVLPNASFTLASGQTLTYTIPVSFTGTVGAGLEFRNVWENGKFLTQATSIANCEATAGSCFFDSYTAATANLYIHAGDGSSVITNGKLYEFTKRFEALSIYGNNGVVSDIRTRRQRNNNGSLQLAGRNSIMRRCTIEDGHKHSAFLGAGGITDRCAFLNGYNGTAAFENFLVIFDGGAGLAGYVVRNCTFKTDSAVSPANASGIIAHTANGTDTFGSSVITSNRYTGLAVGEAVSNTPTLSVNSNLYVDCLGTCQPSAPVTLDWSDNQAVITQALSATANLAPTPIGDGGIITARRNKISSGTYEPMVFGYNSVTVVFEDNLVLVGDTTARFPHGLIRPAGAGFSLTSNRNTFQYSYVSDYVYWLLADSVYVGDHNHFVTNQSFSLDGGSTRKTLAQWRTATSQDANSDTVGDASSAAVYPS